jgi:NADH pyrophosphatase NudC (nudix superfamily)
MMENTGLARKLTAVGTMGEANQLFTVYEKNWNCTDCGQENYPAR